MLALTFALLVRAMLVVHQEFTLLPLLFVTQALRVAGYSDEDIQLKGEQVLEEYRKIEGHWVEIRSIEDWDHMASFIVPCVMSSEKIVYRLIMLAQMDSLSPASSSTITNIRTNTIPTRRSRSQILSSWASKDWY